MSYIHESSTFDHLSPKIEVNKFELRFFPFQTFKPPTDVISNWDQTTGLQESAEFKKM